jgi:hypothetical protein
MRDKKFIRTLSVLCVMIMACGTAFAQGESKLKSGPYQGPMARLAAPEAPAAATFFTNLQTDACTSCNYSADNGYFILGPSNCFSPGATQWISYPFVAGKSGAVKKVLLSITQDTAICTGTSTKFTVAIYSDACTNTPGTQIGSSVIATAPAAPCLLASANFAAAGVTLTAGTRYWVAVTTSTAATQIGTTVVWWMANLAQAPFNLNDGNGWLAFPDGAPGGFTVQ